MQDYSIFVKRKNPHRLLSGWFLCNFTIILYSVDFIKFWNIESFKKQKTLILDWIWRDCRKYSWAWLLPRYLIKISRRESFRQLCLSGTQCGDRCTPGVGQKGVRGGIISQVPQLTCRSGTLTWGSCEILAIREVITDYPGDLPFVLLTKLDHSVHFLGTVIVRFPA